MLRTNVCCLLLFFFTNDQEISKNHRQQSTNQNSWRRDREPVRLGASWPLPSLFPQQLWVFLFFVFSGERIRGGRRRWGSTLEKEIGFIQRGKMSRKEGGEEEARGGGLENRRRRLLVLSGSNKVKQHIQSSWWICSMWLPATASFGSSRWARGRIQEATGGDLICSSTRQASKWNREAGPWRQTFKRSHIILVFFIYHPGLSRSS